MELISGEGEREEIYLVAADGRLSVLMLLTTVDGWMAKGSEAR